METPYDSNGWKLLFMNYCFKNNITFEIGYNSTIPNIPDYLKYGKWIKVSNCPEKIVCRTAFDIWERAVDFEFGFGVK
jgi:hypothetical protein